MCKTHHDHRSFLVTLAPQKHPPIQATCYLLRIQKRPHIDGVKWQKPFLSVVDASRQGATIISIYFARSQIFKLTLYLLFLKLQCCSMEDGAGGEDLWHPKIQTHLKTNISTQNIKTHEHYLSWLHYFLLKQNTLNFVFYTEAAMQGLLQNLGPEHQVAKHPQIWAWDIPLSCSTFPCAAACCYSINTWYYQKPPPEKSIL